MNTNNTNKSNKESIRIEVQDSNKKINSTGDASTTALTINHKQGCKDITTNSINKPNTNCPLPDSNNTTPHSEITVEFAAKQFFQILLVDIKYRNTKLNNKLEPIQSAICGQLSEN